jgi:hypothetical protein
LGFIFWFTTAPEFDRRPDLVSQQRQFDLGKRSSGLARIVAAHGRAPCRDLAWQGVVKPYFLDQPVSLVLAIIGAI